MPSDVPVDLSDLTQERTDWLRVRAYLQQHRHELSAAAAESYSDSLRVAGTPLLSRESWLPGSLVPLERVALERAATRDALVAGTESFTEHLRPCRDDGIRYPSYSAAMGELAAPRVFRNRTTYRLGTAHLDTEGGAMTFAAGTYFDGIDVGEACAHEFAAFRLGLIDGTPLRDAVGDPCDPQRRPTNVAVSTLTLRHDRSTGEASFPLHWRDPAKVGHAGGMYMVMPVGIFQAADDGPAHADNDFSLWRCMLREFAEELLGQPEDHGNGPVDYASWPLASRMTAALAQGRVRAHVVGMGVDPLTLATDLLTVVAIESGLYDELFGQAVDVNDEGCAVHLPNSGQGRWPFTHETVTRLSSREPMQAAGAALLLLAWEHHDEIISTRA